VSNQSQAPPDSQWELPTIPTSTLDMSDTHSDDDTIYPAVSPPSRRASAVPPSATAAHAPSLSPDDLMALWGRVGTGVIAHASELVEQSKKHVIGDGSAEGFVYAVLTQVPNAANEASFGHVIYSQTGSNVQKRASDIMEGDVISLDNAHFKGHKGLSGYTSHVGGGDVPMVGIVHDFESKKSKVRVYQATMHPNTYPTVESVSYRLEDLKSGTVKVYRVAEA